MRGWRMMMAACGVLAGQLFAGQVQAWQYRQVRDQIGNRPTEHSVWGIDTTFRYTADFRCTGPSNVAVFYKVPYAITDAELSKLRSEGAKVGIATWPGAEDKAITMATRFERAPDGNLMVIGTGPELLALMPRLMQMNLEVEFVVDVPSREDYSFQSKIAGVTVEEFIYFAKNCGLAQ